uniref:hypothetical chloroplast RF1 n=1 Tax=Galega orientalis TaxID=47654 RepID=UPI0022DCDBD1|nr:hypothetical chloroplast RF1 [Galega orientalis]UZU69633.1 hypothetical chloroplast RF1 [Galega orientalis]
MDLFTRDKISSNNNELSNYWSSTHNEKRKKLSNEFLKRAKVLDKKYKNKRFKKFFPVDVFENRIRLCNDKKKKKYLTKIYDPLLTGRFRGQIEKGFSTSIINENYTTNNILINKIHGLLLSITSNYPQFDSNYPEFEQKIDRFDRKLLLTEIGFFFNLISKFSEKSVSSLNFDGLYLFPEHEQVKIYSEEKKTKKKILFNAIRTDWNNETIFTRKKCIGINEISKQVPRWSYDLIDEVEQLTERFVKDAHIRSPRTERIVVFDGKTDSLSLSPRNQNIDNTDDNRMPEPDLNHEFALLKYSREPDYSREIIRGSLRPQRRKTVTSKLFQSNVHSPIFLEIIDDYPLFFGELFDDISQYLKEYFRKPGTDNSEFLDFEKRMEHKNKEENKDEAERRLREIEESWESILYGLIIRSFVLLTQSIIRKYILLPSLIITKNIIRILLFQNPEWSEDFRDWRKEVHIKCTYQGIPVSHNELPKNWFNDGIQIRVLSPFVLKPWHKSRGRSTEKKKYPLKNKNIFTEKNNFWFLTAYGTLIESYLDDHFPNPISFLYPILKKIKKQLKKDLKNRFFLVLNIFNERKTWFRTMLKEIENWNIKSILFRFKKIDELSESKKIDELSESKKIDELNNNPMIEESRVIIQSINWTSSSFTEKRIKDLNVKTETIIKQIEKMTEEKKEGVINSEKNLNSNKTIYDAKTFELQKNIFQILQRRNVRLTRKFYSFFKFFMESIYIDILLWISSIPRIHGQRFLDFLESTNKIVNVNKSIYNKKKNEEKIYKTNASIIPFMSVIDKSWNITNMNSQNSCDVSSLSQAYVFFKLAQIQFSNGDKYKLRSIFESHSKLRHKNLPDSVMNHWTNWLKIHYQYDLPRSRWSTLVPQNWRNRINEHRVVQKKELVGYDSYEKSQLILDKKQQVDLLEIKKKIKKQYRYDLFCYQYINYTDKKKSDIYGSRSSPFQANKNEAISYNYNTCKNQLFEIIGDISIENYIAEDYIAEDNIAEDDIDIMDMEKNMDRRYLNRMVRNLQRKKNSIPNKKLPNPRFWFFSKLRIFYDAYKKNPWIQPRLIKRLFLEVYGSGVKNSITALETQEYARQVNFKSYSSNHSVSDESFDFDKYRYDLKGERDFLLEKYLGFYLDFDSSLQENLMKNINLYCLMVRLKSVRQFFIMSLQKADLDIESMVIPMMKEDFPLTGYRDNYEFQNGLMFIIEPVRLSIKNYEQFFIYQTIRLPLIHKSKSKRKILKRKPEKSRVDQKIRENKNHYDLLIPENLLSTRRRRELRILICFNPRNRNTVHRNAINYNENKINNQVLTKNKDLDSETKKLRNLKFFLWPNYRLEDLACINRYWFDTHNGSRFSILRIHMYPRLKN